MNGTSALDSAAQGFSGLMTFGTGLTGVAVGASQSMLTALTGLDTDERRGQRASQVWSEMKKPKNLPRDVAMTYLVYDLTAGAYGGPSLVRATASFIKNIF